MPDFLVDIEEFGDSLKIVWSVENLPYRPYLINAGNIVSVTKDQLRPALAALTRARMRGERCDEELKSLAEAGKLLYDTFFTVRGGNREEQRRVDAIRDRVGGSRGRTICFAMKPRIFVPWGLMCSNPDPPCSSAIVDHEEFWLLKYSVSTVHKDLVTPANFEASFPAGKFQLIRAVDSEEFSRSNVAAHESTVALHLTLDREFGPPIGTKLQLMQAWKDRESRLGLLYFYCHSNQTRIALSSKEELDTIEFANKYRKMSDDADAPLCLVFLNGCHTAVGAEGGGFLDATGRDGFCGFIGTETAVPSEFAHNFGSAVIARLYQGESLIEIMNGLRRQHWPLSLIYGLYACPSLRLRVQPDEAGQYFMAAAPGVNFSDLPTGPRTL